MSLPSLCLWDSWKTEAICLYGGGALETISVSPLEIRSTSFLRWFRNFGSISCIALRCFDLLCVLCIALHCGGWLCIALHVFALLRIASLRIFALPCFALRCFARIGMRVAFAWYCIALLCAFVLRCDALLCIAWLGIVTQAMLSLWGFWRSFSVAR